jgi:DNA helicase HerA-like ATPase
LTEYGISDEEADKIVQNIQKDSALNGIKSMHKVSTKRPIAEMLGKGDVYNFKIQIFSEDIRNFNFLKVYHKSYDDYILCQITNIIRDNGNKLAGNCKIIGYRKEGVLKRIRVPFDMFSKIKLAEDIFIEKTIGMNRVKGAFIGTMENHNLKVQMDFKDMLTKHIGILAKSGAGKSYTVGVLLEEIIQMGIPIVILDPHNEYASLKLPNDKQEDIDNLNSLNMNPIGFNDTIKEWSPDVNLNPTANKLNLSLNNMTPMRFIESLPQKLTQGMKNMVFNILSSMNNRINMDELIFNISNEESNSKWTLISLIEDLKKQKVFTTEGTPLNQIVKHRQASVISLKGVNPNMQDIVVTNLLSELFEARKREEIPPFLLVLEEAHNFAPEKGMKGVKSLGMVRIIAGEGRKFGMGLCVISQRPAKVDKNVLSQCSTQIIMKMTNPLDLQSAISSCEGLDKDSANEIQQLRVGSCLLTGIIDIPLKVKVRPRMTKHGGDSANIRLGGLK